MAVDQVGFIPRISFVFMSYADDDGEHKRVGATLKCALLSVILLCSVACKAVENYKIAARYNKKVIGLELVSVIERELSISKPCLLELQLISTAFASVEIGIKSPYSDCGIYIYRETGEPCMLTQFGRTALDSRVVAATDRGIRVPPDPAIDSPDMGHRPDLLSPGELNPVFVGRSWVETRIPGRLIHDSMKRAGVNEPPNSNASCPKMSWSVDLQKLFVLTPGRYVIIANYKYVGIDGTIELQSLPKQFLVR